MDNLMYKASPTVYIGLRHDVSERKVTLRDRVGVISDFDLAIDLDDPASEKQRGSRTTCTWPFAPRSLLRQPNSHFHNLIHDVEGLMWTYFLTRSQYRDGKRTNPENADQLMSQSLSAIYSGKILYFADLRERCKAFFDIGNQESSNLFVKFCAALSYALMSSDMKTESEGGDIGSEEIRESVAKMQSLGKVQIQSFPNIPPSDLVDIARYLLTSKE